jgi:hypothetical protein
MNYSLYSLATKMEALKGRGGGDYVASHDMEDIITVLDGRFECFWQRTNSSMRFQGICHPIAQARQDYHGS